MNTILLILFCIIPTILLLTYIYINDKVEKEPFYLLLILFLGGLIACNLSILFSTIFKYYFPFLNLQYEKLNIYQILFKIIITISIIEELSKWLINYITIWKNKNFKHIYDPIVYCTFVSLGFATLENIIYCFALKSYGITPIIVRGITSVPSHAVFGIFMGYYLGISKNSLMYHKENQSTKYRLLSIIVPIILHSIYDILLVNKNTYTYIVFIIYITICYILANLKIKKLASVHKNLKE